MLVKFIVLIIGFQLFLNANNYGELLFDGNCVTCHVKSKSVSAPSIKEIRKNYLQAFPKQNDFINYMSTWVINPKVETSLMSQSIEKFGLMPQLGYDKFTLEQISEYIYKTEF